VEPVERGEVDEGELEEAARIHLSVTDMGCPNCAHRVRNALLAVPGVLDVAVHLGAGQAAVACRDGSVGVDHLVGAVEDASQGTRHQYTADVLRVV
jgi:copper chaperone CopZ